MTSMQTQERESLFAGVNEPSDFDNMSDLEKKHLPVIEGPDTVKPKECFEISVEVGKLKAHPNEHEHFIQFMDVYADETFLARADFSSCKACPKVAFCLSLEEPAHEIRVYEHCNMHGTWVGRKSIRME